MRTMAATVPVNMRAVRRGEVQVIRAACQPLLSVSSALVMFQVSAQLRKIFHHVSYL